MKYPEMIKLHPPLRLPWEQWWLGGFEGSLWYAACYSFWDEITLPHHLTQLHCVKFFGFPRLYNQPLFFVAPSHIACLMESQTRMLRNKKRKSRNSRLVSNFFAAVFTMVQFACQKTSDKLVYKKSGRGSDLGKCNPATGLHKKPTGLCQWMPWRAPEELTWAVEVFSTVFLHVLFCSHIHTIRHENWKSSKGRTWNLLKLAPESLCSLLFLLFLSFESCLLCFFDGCHRIFRILKVFLTLGIQCKGPGLWCLHHLLTART